MNRIDELDKKLDELLKPIKQTARSEDTYIEANKLKLAIKQAFKDTGWIMISPNQQEEWRKADRMFREDDTPLMTGQEWYDRFTVEYLSLLGLEAGTLVDGDAITAAKKAAGVE